LLDNDSSQKMGGAERWADLAGRGLVGVRPAPGGRVSVRREVRTRPGTNFVFGGDGKRELGSKARSWSASDREGGFGKSSLTTAGGSAMSAFAASSNAVPMAGEGALGTGPAVGDRGGQGTPRC
jgi:hypothetical protein